MEFEFEYGKHLRSKRARPIICELGGTDGDCWECISHRLENDGYPRINIGHKKWKLSRWAFTVYHDRPIAQGMHILHSCDNKLCINPLHLREGTDHDNTMDKIARGRMVIPLGEHNGKSKLTEQQVREQ